MTELVAAVFAETPFQLIAGLNVARNYLKATSCVLFPMSQMHASANGFHVFPAPPFVTDIYPCKRVNANSWGYKIKRLLFGSNYRIKVSFDTPPPKSLHFDVAIGTKYSSNIIYMLRYMGQRAPVYLVEEGIGDYTDPVIRHLPVAPAWAEETKWIESVTRVYMMPEYFKQITGLSALPAPIMSGDKNGALVNTVLGETSMDQRKLLNATKIFYCDLPGTQSRQSSFQSNPVEKAVLDCLSNSGLPVVVKKHPRSMNDYASFTGFEQVILPLEQVFFNLDKPEETVIITQPSTVLIMPKELLGVEPYIVSLHLLYEENFLQHTSSEEYKTLTDVVYQVKSRYSNPDKIFVPRNLAEFKAIIEKLSA